MGRNNTDVKGVKNPNYKTGFTSNGKPPSFYNSWQNMKARCLRKNHPKYCRYGGRGISICDEWLDIKGFALWALNNNWREGLSLDRIDNNGGYNPDNCRWVSHSENSRKKSSTKISYIQAGDIRKRIANGEDMNDLAKEYGVVHGTIWFIKENFTHVPEGECVKRLKERDDK